MSSCVKDCLKKYWVHAGFVAIGIAVIFIIAVNSYRWNCCHRGRRAYKGRGCGDRDI
jgi:hypothetical protein